MIEYLRKSVPDENIPFAAKGSQGKKNIIRDRRFSYTLDFVDKVGSPCLDIGSKSILTEKLSDRFSVEIDNTLPCDFNIALESPQKEYDTIFCFEVIEHVMNPYGFMKNIRKKLDGNLYLSTPILGLLGILQIDAHFTEYKQSRLEILFRSTGFEIVKKQKFNSVPLWGISGIRPIIHKMFMDNIIYKLQ